MTITQNNFACDIGRRKINRIEVILFLIIYSGHDPLLLHDLSQHNDCAYTSEACTNYLFSSTRAVYHWVIAPHLWGLH